MEWNRGNGRKEYIKQIPDEIKAQYFQQTKNTKFQSPTHFKQLALNAIDTLKGEKLSVNKICKQLNISQTVWNYYRNKPDYCQAFYDIYYIITQRKGDNKKLKETKQELKNLKKLDDTRVVSSNHNIVMINKPHPSSKDLKDEIVVQSFQKISEKLRLGEYDDKQLIEIFKEAVKLSGFTKPDVEINNCLASQKVFVTKEDIDKTNQLINEVLNEQ